MSFEQLKLSRVEKLADVEELMRWLGERRPILAVDLETTGLNAGCDQIRLFQVGDGQRGWALDYCDWRGVAREIIHGYDRPMVCHNLLFDSKMLRANGITIPQRWAHDTMIMAFLVNPAQRMGLKAAAAKYVDPRANVGQGVLEQAMSAGGWTWTTVPTDLPAYWWYGVLDTCLTAMLAEKLWPMIRDTYRRAYELELAYIHVLREAELAGLLVDEDVRQRTASKLQHELDELRPKIPLDNPNSDTQVVRYLRGIGAPLTVKTERGNWSVDKHVMTYLAKLGYEVAGHIGAYRSRGKMLGSYIDKFAEVTAGGLAVDGVLRCNTRPVGARTGRSSITDPPLQTLPKGRVIRDCIVARPGHRILLADFKAMEMRALASLANEETMLEAFNRGEDIHDYVAESVYGPTFTKQQRATAKNAGFAAIYGAGLEKFAVTAGIPVDEAQTFLSAYDERFPGVACYMRTMVNSIMQRAGGRRSGWGQVELQDGRRLPVEASKAYVAVNYRIQGGTAVAMKERAVALDAAGLGPFFRLSVHDEFLFEVPDEHVPLAREIIRRVMPDHTSFPGVVLEIDQDEVTRWGEHYRGDDYPKYVESEDPEWLT